MSSINAKVGDELVKKLRYGAGMITRRVGRITPSGRIVLNNECTLNPNGRARDGSGKWRHITDADREALALQRARSEARYQVGHIDWRTIPLEQCNAILAALGQS